MTTSTTFFPSIAAYIEALPQTFDTISDTRKQQLQSITSFLQEKQAAQETAELIFICTHNSRRSHFSQVWMHVLAEYYGIKGIASHSGGTESTAFHPHALEALYQIGFDITHKGRENNPRHKLTFSAGHSPITAWSKLYTDPANPRKNFCAIMTCSDADQNCPIVFGAKKRFALPFEDPKVADGTPQEAEVYAARCKQIATEIAFILQALI